VRNMMGLREVNTGKTMNRSQNFEGKLEKVLKTELFMQNMRFSQLI